MNEYIAYCGLDCETCSYIAMGLLLSGNLYFAVPSEKNPIIHIFVSL